MSDTEASAPTRDEIADALTKMGVTVPDDWHLEQVAGLYEELINAGAAETYEETAFSGVEGASPRG